MDKIKCITFDKAAQDNIPQDIKDKMKADRAKAEKEQETKIKTLPMQNASNNEMSVCDHSHGFYFDEKGIITCVRCHPPKEKQTDC